MGTGIGIAYEQSPAGPIAGPAPAVAPGGLTVLEAPGGYVVEITAANTGGATAQGVMIEGELREKGPSPGTVQQGNGNRQSSAGGGGQQSGMSGGQQGRGKVVEKSSTTIQWVPAHAERQGGLFFSRNPLDYELKLRPQGYERP